MSIRLQERIRDLEQALQEERRALAESQQRCNELERKYQDILLRPVVTQTLDRGGFKSRLDRQSLIFRFRNF